MTLGYHTTPTDLSTPAVTEMLKVASDGLTLAPGATKTATAVAGAATLNQPVGRITSEALTTAAAADYTLTLTNSFVTAASKVFVQVGNGTNTTAPAYAHAVALAAGSVVIKVRNGHATAALNGTITVDFLVVQ